MISNFIITAVQRNFAMKVFIVLSFYTHVEVSQVTGDNIGLVDWEFEIGHLALKYPVIRRKFKHYK